MYSHLTLKSVPELTELPWLQRNRVYRRCLRQRAPWSWWTCYILFICFVVAVASFTAGRSSLPRWSHPLIVTGVLGLAIVVSELLMKFFFLRNRADAFRAYIISRCIHCNHNLRNTLDAGETACPRCGQSLTHAQQQRAAQHSPTGATA